MIDNQEKTREIVRILEINGDDLIVVPNPEGGYFGHFYAHPHIQTIVADDLIELMDRAEELQKSFVHKRFRK